MYYNYFICLRNNQFIPVTYPCFKSFVIKSGLKNKVLSFFKQKQINIRVTIFYFMYQRFIKIYLMLFC
jgi:hypothetical protein